MDEKADRVPKKRPLASQLEKTTVRKKSYCLDLRVHAPQALGYFEVEGLQPAPALIRLARVKGIDLLGVTDLYCCDFIDEVQHAAKNSNVHVIPGVDLRCRVDHCNDVLLSCFFEEGCPSEEIRAFLAALHVPTGAARRSDFQVAVPFDRVLAEIEERGAFALPIRIDKTPYRLSVLPVLVERYGFRAFEIAYPEETPPIFKAKWPALKFQLFSFSNANALAQVGSRVEKVKMPTPGFPGLREMVARSAQLAEKLPE